MKRSNQNTDVSKSKAAHVSTGDVLDDLGFSPAESLALKIKADLLDAILREVERKGYTQAQLTTIVDDYQPQISNLLRGRISSFSVEKLLKYAHSLRMQPVLTLRSPAHSRRTLQKARNRNVA